MKERIKKENSKNCGPSNEPKISENLTTVQQERQLNIFGSPNQNNVDIN